MDSSVTYYLKHMVCRHCIRAVENVLADMGVAGAQVSLGEVRLNAPMEAQQLTRFADALQSLGFELLTDKRLKLIEQVKTTLIEVVREDVPDRFQLSGFLQDRLGRSYSAISKLFSEVEGITIERYFILLKIERTKEWIVYDELTLGEIAVKLGYSSTAHLSAQFKSITGLPPSHFKKLAENKRKPLNEVG